MHIKKFKDYSIKKKYAGIIILLSIIPLILLSFLLYSATLNSIDDELEFNTITRITSAEYLINSFIESMITTASISSPNIARDIEQGDIGNIDKSVFNIYNTMKFQKVGDDMFKDSIHIAIVVNQEGFVISRSDIEKVGNKLSSNELGTGFDIALNGTLDYRKRLFNRHFMLAGPQSKLISYGFENFMGLVVHKPIFNTRGTQVGTLIIISMINNNSNMIDLMYHNLNFKFTSYAPDGEVMVSYFQNPPTVTPEIIKLSKEAIDEMIANTRSTKGKDSIVHTIDRIYLVGMYGETNPYRFSFFVQPYKDGFLSIRGFALCLKKYDALILERQKYIASILVITTILISLIGTLLTKSITVPILDLTDAAKKMSAGDFDVKLPNKNKDEIGQLINAFDFMRLNIKKEQDTIKNIIQFMPYPVFLIYVDKDEKLKYANDELANWAGYEKIDDIIGHKLVDIFNIKTDTLLANVVFKSGNEIINKEKTFKNIKGIDETYLISCLPIYDINKEVSAVLEILIDITDLKKAKFELLQKNKELESFAHTVSHDLKSPLLTIKGLSNMLKSELDGKIEGDAEMYIKHIINGADKMEVLLSEILQLSRAGRIIKSKEKVPFNILVDDAISQLQSEITAHKVDFKIAKNFPMVFVDHVRLIEVLINLIGNSIRYIGGENDNPLIEIGYCSDSKTHEFFIKDNGIGIDKLEHDKIFDLFYRVSEKIKGTGTGLAIVKKIINAHGGDIWVESEKGSGCIFYFTLPIECD